MQTIKVYKELKLKDGTIIPAKSHVDIEPTESDSICVINGKYKVRYTSVIKAPSMKALERMCFDAIAETPLGNDTEPDGTDEFGFPAWPRILGFI